jgi:hypothetical protein
MKAGLVLVCALICVEAHAEDAPVVPAVPAVEEPYVFPPPPEPSRFRPLFEQGHVPFDWHPELTTDERTLAAMTPALRADLRRRARRSLKFARAAWWLNLSFIVLGTVEVGMDIALLIRQPKDYWHDPLTITCASFGGALSAIEATEEPLNAVAKDDARYVASHGLASLHF